MIIMSNDYSGSIPLHHLIQFMYMSYTTNSKLPKLRM